MCPAPQIWVGGTLECSYMPIWGIIEGPIKQIQDKPDNKIFKSNYSQHFLQIGEYLLGVFLSTGNKQVFYFISV